MPLSTFGNFKVNQNTHATVSKQCIPFGSTFMVLKKLLPVFCVFFH